MGWGQAQLTGLPCSGSSSHCPGASLAIGGHQQLPPPSRADSTSPRSWLGSAGPRQGGGGGEPLLLSQQLLLPLPVLLKLWLWTQGGGGSQSPAAPAPPRPPHKGQPRPPGPLSWLFIAPRPRMRSWISPPSNVSSCGHCPRDAARCSAHSRCAVPGQGGGQARASLQVVRAFPAAWFRVRPLLSSESTTPE